MRFSDRLVRCEACGVEFVYTVREQRQRAAQGLPLDPPAFCRDCRSADVRLAEVDTAVSQDSAATEHSATATTGEAAVPEKSEAAVTEQRPSPAGDQASRAKGKRESSRKPRTRRGRSSGRSSGRKRGGRSQKPPRQTELRIRHIGTVKWFDEDRGFGFIAQDDGEELFVHSTGVLVKAPHGLEQGQQVEYEIEHTKRGLQAVDVVPLS